MTRCKPLPVIIGKFKVIEDLGWDGKKRWALFECPICLKPCKKRVDAIKRYDSCGCGFYTPNISRRLQRIHNAMMARCYRKTQVHYDRYGGRGIITCEEWKDSKKFYQWAINNGYEEYLTIDRIDNEKGYSPENCRWATQVQQGRNRKNNVVTEEIARQIQAEPWRASLDELCKKYGLKRSTIKVIKYKQVWKDL